SLAAILPAVYGVKEIARDGFAALPAGLILAGVVVGVAFVRRQQRLDDPLIDVRLFRGRTFSAALGANVLGAFVMYGIFYFISQYLQLVLDLSPLEAGLWGLPGIAGLMATAMLVPKIVQRVRPGFVVAAGLAVTAVGFALLTALDPSDGIALLVVGSVIASIGIAPGTTLGTNLMVSSAPPENAGSVAGVAQTGNELGGALGIALLGSLGAALYRSDIAGAIPGGTAPDVARAAHDTLGGAVSVADRLPAGVLDAAQAAFAHGLDVAAATCAVLMIGAAIATAVLLRHVPKSAAAPGAPQPEPARDVAPLGGLVTAGEQA
ncbi:MAG: transporter, family, multidrug resistance protein, partial [Solirubrobacteraceae bacterium]|nr:transporter, family, multidrug resistance protein [Solirubrobacteraceae bacterium]